MSRHSGNIETRKWRVIAHAALGVLAFIALLAIVDFWRARQDTTNPSNPDIPSIAGFEQVSFAGLEGWHNHNAAAALPPFLISCRPIALRNLEDAFNKQGTHPLFQAVYGRVEDWQPLCAKAQALEGATDADARAFFEANFALFKIHQPAATPVPETTTTGLFTGYFEPIYAASSTRTDSFTVPALPRPDDLITIDLGAFREELKGTRLAGRIENGTLIPYADHQQIIEDRPESEALAWMDPNELLFLQIQGSGKLALNNDTNTEMMRIGYDAQNGHQYVAVGRTLVREHGVPLKDISMQSIKQWLKDAAPDQAAQVRYSNPSYVFFKKLEDLPDPTLGPLGAQGVQLTPLRSLAVDRKYHAMGAPMWVDIPALEEADGKPFRQLMIAQDTGGAINGAIRGDVFWGAGKDAGEKAGTQDASGHLYMLVPLSVAKRLGAAQGTP